MFKKGIIRFIKAHGIAVIAVIILALILKFVLHFSFFLSFLVLLILYFATGFVIDVISEKIRLKKARKDISKHDERSIRNRADNIPAAQDSDNGTGETIFEGVNDIDRSENGRTRSKQHLSLRKLSTDMKSIIAASPDDEKNGNRNSRSEGRSVPSGKEKRMSSSDYMRGTDFTYTRFAERNSMKAAKDNAERENVSRTSAEPDAASKVNGDPLAAAIAFDNDPAGVLSEDTALAETTAINKENDTADTAAPDHAAQEAVSAVSAAVISEIDETKDAPVTAPEQDAASGQAEGNAAQTLGAEETAEETIEEAKDARDVAPSADGTLFDSPDIDGDTRFSEGITDAVDKMLSETPKSIVRRNRYIISDKTENSENAETRGSSVNVVTDVDPGNTGKTGKAEKTDKTGYSDSEPERDVRSHISKDIDTGNTLFSVEEKDDEPEEENDEQQGKDRVNTDSSMMNAIFGGRKQEHHKKPSLEEYRRRTEKTGSARRNLTKEILEGNPSENSRESDAISLFDTEPDRGARTDIPAPVIAAVPEAAEVKEETKKEEKLPEIKRVYEIPPVDLLAGARGSDNVGVINSEDDPKAQKLISTLESFGVGAKIIGVMRGPAVTRYELQPNPGVKVSRIVALSDDIALNMASTGVRIEAPIPGKEAVGIEVPNSQVEIVSLRQVVESEEFRSSQSSLTVALGRDIAGKNIVADIAKMPHLLIAGATGSGKSVCINTIVASILFKAGPEDVRMIMIDPKIVELGVYNGIPHLLVPVVTNPKKAAGALAWAVSEMENRYTLFSEHNVRDIKAFNVLAQRDKSITKLPQILIIIDELADLMMVAAKEIEDSIIRLSQKARAAGLHIIIATQRPSVDVITGLIKANIPSRIAFAVTSQIDSRTILDGGGAEKLLGRGDMLFHPIGMAKPLRVQGAFVSDSEIEALADNVRNSYGTALYSDEIQSSIDQKDKPQGGGNSGQSDGGDDDQDADYEMIDAAAQLALEYKQLSTSFLQRKLRLGYSRASRIVDTLEAEGLISEADGSKPRQLLMSKEEWESHIAEVRGEKT